MGDFTDKDREKLTEVHIIVKSQGKLLADHEMRLRRTEKMTTTLAAWAGGVAILAGVVWDTIKGKFGS